jgi:hypothetical protein
VSILINRVKEIKKKGFSMNLAPDTQDVFSYQPTDFSKIKVGLKTLDDAILELGDYSRLDNRLGNKDTVMKAMYDCDYETMKEISNFFYKTSGIYSRLCRYMAYLYRYDWMVTPFVNSESVKKEKVIEGFYKALTYLDNFEIKRFCGDVALKVLRFGCYYGYKVQQADRMVIQELPIKYCRSRFSKNGLPTVEFNMKYFDDAFSDIQYRIRVLNMFPKDFQKGYMLFK